AGRAVLRAQRPSGAELRQLRDRAHASGSEGRGQLVVEALGGLARADVAEEHVGRVAQQQRAELATAGRRRDRGLTELGDDVVDEGEHPLLTVGQQRLDRGRDLAVGGMPRSASWISFASVLLISQLMSATDSSGCAVRAETD